MQGSSRRRPINLRDWTEGRTESSRGLRPEVGTRFWRYGDMPRHTRRNRRNTAAKDAAMDELRNNPGEGLLELWERN
jgi:hypothetical protein